MEFTLSPDIFYHLLLLMEFSYCLRKALFFPFRVCPGRHIDTIVKIKRISQAFL